MVTVVVACVGTPTHTLLCVPSGGGLGIFRSSQIVSVTLR